MNKRTFSEITKRLQEVNGVIKDLDQSIRSAAFLLLRDYITGTLSGADEDTQNEERETLGGDEKEEFFSRFSCEKPSDNALLIAGYHYSRYGVVPFSTTDVKTIADEVGITIPDRVDMTFKNAQRKGKNLFRSTGKNRFQPTVHGEKFFKDTYNVSKGKMKKASE